MSSYFQERRSVLLICGGGFDERAAVFPKFLAQIMTSRLQVVALREERPSPQRELVTRAEVNIATIADACLVPPKVESVDVFGSGNAVVIGRRSISAVTKLDLRGVTDVIVDLSALSIGASFPIVQYFDKEVVSKQKINLHVVLVPTGGQGIPGNREVVDEVSYVHGFRAGFGKDEAHDAAKLWIPQLGVGRRGVLERIHGSLNPDEVVPVLPFPCHPPRRGDDLLREYLEEIESVWEVDRRSVLHADERHPLDLYRSISRLCASRAEIFGGLKKSFVVLTPLGSNALSIGALMAAMELNLPIAYVETLAYASPPLAAPITSVDNLVHIWIAGDVYPEAGRPDGQPG